MECPEGDTGIGTETNMGDIEEGVSDMENHRKPISLQGEMKCSLN